MNFKKRLFYLCCLLAINTQAADYYWIGSPTTGNGNWQDASMWVVRDVNGNFSPAQAPPLQNDHVFLMIGLNLIQLLQ